MMFSFFKEINGVCVCVALVLVLIAAMFLALAVGTVKIPLEQIYAAIVNQLQSGTSLDGALKGSVHDIIWQLPAENRFGCSSWRRLGEQWRHYAGHR